MTYRDNPEIAKKYKTKRWKLLRKRKILQNPMCERCYKQGKVVPVYIVHHKEHITDNNYLDDNIFYNIDNLESLCQDCHNKEHFGYKKEYFFDNEGNVLKAET